MEKTGHKHTDDLTGVDWYFYDLIIKNTDFTKMTTTDQVVKGFYEMLWVHVIGEVKAENNSLQQQLGKFIIEADEQRREKERLQKEVDSLREELSKENPRETRPL